MKAKLLVFPLKIIFFLNIISPIALSAQAPMGNQEQFSTNICNHIRILASDAYEGRKPGTAGEEKTIQYIKKQFEDIGLRPAAKDGTYFQKVALANYATIAPGQIKLSSKTGQVEWQLKKDFLLSSQLTQDIYHLSPTSLVFAGFGIHAPEIGWDDYEHLDVKDKVVVVLSGTPDQYTEDSTLWHGDPAANIYSKGFYKKNEAAARGAKGVLFIYQQQPHSYWNWESIGKVYGQNNMTIKRTSNEQQIHFDALVTKNAVEQLFSLAGIQAYDFHEEALKPDFRGLDLSCKIQLSFSNTWSDLNTHNVVGLLPGTDRADEVILYTAHWDHVGIGPAIDGDSIRNGAVDNASGTAGMIEIARAFKTQATPPRRSILFIATGAEELGLLGAVWYAKHPLFPLGKTLASLNLDGHFPYGKTTHITGVVYGRSGLDPYLEEAANQQGRIIVPNTAQNIAQSIFFRSDHFPLAEAGIPSEFAVGAGSAMGHDSVVWEQKMKTYMPKYHQPTDEYESHFDCGGIWQDAELIYQTGNLLDQADAFPMWDEDQPFQKWRTKARFESTYFKDVSASHLPLMSLQGRSMDAKPADLDGDGDIDLVIANEHSYNIILINDGKGHFTDESQKRLPLKRRDSEDIALGDFDGDGDIDLIFVSEDDQVNEYYENDGKGFFADRSYKIPLGGCSNAIISRDLNGDKLPDLIIGNAPSKQGQGGKNFCLINDGKGGWLDESSLRLPSTIRATQDLELADIDQDGDDDLIIANEDGNQLLINDGKGFFEDQTSKRLSASGSDWETREADFADIDGDGDLDLFFANVNFRQTKDAQNRILINNGKGFFKDVTVDQLPSEKMHTVDADFYDLDGDNDLDILTGNSFGHSYMAYLNDGKGNFTNEAAVVIPPSIRGDGIDMETADFDGDGILDLYFCNFMGHDFLLFGKRDESNSNR